MRKSDLAAAYAIVTHEQPASQALFDMMHGIGQGRISGLRPESLHESQKQAVDFWMLRQYPRQSIRFYPPCGARRLDGDIVCRGETSQNGRHRRNAVATDNANFGPVSCRRNADYGAKAALGEVIVLNRLVDVCDYESLREFNRLQISRKGGEAGIRAKAKQPILKQVALKMHGRTSEFAKAPLFGRYYERVKRSVAPAHATRVEGDRLRCEILTRSETMSDDRASSPVSISTIGAEHASEPFLTDEQKITEAHFLADNFGIAPIRAAELIVGEGSEADNLASKVMLEERERDPLAGVPVPGGTKDPEHIEEGAEDLEKPVVHEESAPT